MDNQETPVTLGTHHTERRQTNKRQKQPTKMDNQDTLTTLDTHHTERRQTNKRQKKPHKNGQSSDTDNIGYTSHRTKTNKQKTKKNPLKWTIKRH